MLGLWFLYRQYELPLRWHTTKETHTLPRESTVWDTVSDYVPMGHY